MSSGPFELPGFYVGDCRTLLSQLPDESVQCVVTSPPYWRLRDYGVAGQIGLEDTVDEYVAQIVCVFREVRRALRPDGVLWLNLGDTYASDGGSAGPRQDHSHGEWLSTRGAQKYAAASANRIKRPVPDGLKTKDMIGIPWRIAFALQADGWYLRADLIWNKPNVIPESVLDRPMKSHEYVFLLAKSERYYYDRDAVRVPATGNSHDRGNGVNPKAREANTDHAKGPRTKANAGFSAAMRAIDAERNLRSVWTSRTAARTSRPSRPSSSSRAFWRARRRRRAACAARRGVARPSSSTKSRAPSSGSSAASARLDGHRRASTATAPDVASFSIRSSGRAPSAQSPRSTGACGSAST